MERLILLAFLTRHRFLFNFQHQGHLQTGFKKTKLLHQNAKFGWTFIVVFLLFWGIKPTFAAPNNSLQEAVLGFDAQASTLKKGSRGSQVTQLQQNLKTLGYFKGEITGYYGDLTQESVKRFQASQGLKPDGIAGSKTLDYLNSQVNQLPESQSNSSQDNSNPTRGDIRRTSNSTPFKIEIADSVKKGFEQAIALLKNPNYQAVEFVASSSQNSTQQQTKMTHKKTIYGQISPKSVVHSGNGLFFAQNMMYRHTVTIYDRNFNLVKTLPDTINLSKFGYSKFSGDYKGSPVEASFSTDGKYAYVSNYKMYGSGFKRPGTDTCTPAGKHDSSFLYKINTENLNIEKVIQVGSVPKFTAVTPDNRYVLVSNWCTWDLSVIDTQKNQEIKRIKIGRYPRGIAVDPKSQYAYIAVMGSSNIAKVNLNTFSVESLNNIGRSPRHLNIDPNGKYLYATLNSEGKIAKIDLSTGKVLKKINTGSAPRSMVISEDGERLYVVNYSSNTVSKVRTQDMKVLQTVKVNHHPIGITYDPQTRQVWVACYSGSIMVFQD